MFLALIEAGYGARRFRKKGDHLESFSLGELLRVNAKLFAKRPRDGGGSENGREDIATNLMRKRSGSHDVGSLSWYDKAAQLGLSATQAREQGLADSLRLDITFQARGIAKMLTEAQRLAKKHGVDLTLDRTAAGEVVRSTKNIVDAISLIDGLYEA